MFMQNSYFCPMRAVRVYLKRLKYLSCVTRDKTYLIFCENTKYYLEGKITRKFYANLADELLHAGNESQIWRKLDLLPEMLKTASVIEKLIPDEQISKINLLLIQYLQKRKQKFSLTSSITAGLEKLAQSYVGLLSISSRI